MKNVSKLKLIQLSKDELKKREMNLLKGGDYTDCCGCGFGTDNRNANSAAGYGSSAGDTTGNCWNWSYNEENGEWSYSNDHTKC